MPAGRVDQLPRDVGRSSWPAGRRGSRGDGGRRLRCSVRRRHRAQSKQRWRTASPVAKAATARGLTRLADALRAGQPGPIRAALEQFGAGLPEAQRAEFVTQALRLMRDVEPATAALATEEPAPQPPRSGTATR